MELELEPNQKNNKTRTFFRRNCVCGHDYIEHNINGCSLCKCGRFEEKRW